MSTNDEIEDAITRHQIFVQRYAKGREEAYQLYIEDLLEQTRARLTFDLTPESRVRTERLMLDLKALAEQLTGELTEETMDEMRRFMTQEAQFNYEILDTRVVADLSLPNANQIEAALSTNIMQLEPTKGYTIRSALAEFGSRKAQQIVQVIRDGTVLGETTQAIIQGIMDLGSVQKRQAATLARTITNHVATQARDLTMGDNRDILEGYKWVATLDGRTSLICASRDGKIFPIADDSPKPPAHFNCRSTISFAVKPEFDLGADLPGTRSSIDGPVDRNLTFGDWLRRQSPEFQEQVLGRERAKLFREQNIPIDRFVDDQGRVLSLDQLRRMDEDFNGIAPPPDLAPPAIPELELRPAFTRAKNTEEVKDRIRATGVTGIIDLKGMKLDHQNAVLEAFENEARHAPLDRLRGVTSSARAPGRRARAWYAPSVQTLGLNKALLKKGHSASDPPKPFPEQLSHLEATIAKWKSDYLGNIEYNQKKVIGGIRRMESEIGHLKDKIRRGEEPKWWSMSAKQRNEYDQIYATVTHELGHYRHFEHLRYRTIYSYSSAATRKSPTEYGSQSEEEYFAELFTLYRLEGPDNVPGDVLDMIKEISGD